MKSSARNIQMTSYDDLFSVDAPVESVGEKVQEIALDQLYPFQGHPFKVLDDEAMQEMVESFTVSLFPALSVPVQRAVMS